MGSSGKKKTTAAKLARENRLRERRLSKQAKKDARKQVFSDPVDARDHIEPTFGVPAVREPRSSMEPNRSQVEPRGAAAGQADIV